MKCVHQKGLQYGASRLANTTKLDWWQLYGRIATRAARRALSSRQYGIRVKCGPAGMRARAVGRKVGGCCAPLR